MLKKLPKSKAGRDRSDSTDSDATLVGDLGEQDFTILSKSKESPRSANLVRHISWAAEPVKPPKRIIVTVHDVGNDSDLYSDPSTDSDTTAQGGNRGEGLLKPTRGDSVRRRRTPSPYPDKPEDHSNSRYLSPAAPRPIPTGQPGASDPNPVNAANPKTSNQAKPTSRQVAQPLLPPPPRRTCQCPHCASTGLPVPPLPRRRHRRRLSAGWIPTDPSRDSGAVAEERAPRLLWETTDSAVVASVRPARGRTAGRGHAEWAPSHSPAPGWRFREGVEGLWGVDAGELREVLGRVKGEREGWEVGMGMRKEGKGGGGGLVGSSRETGPWSWRNSVMWEMDCYHDLFGMYLG
ncbi:hypothetical protein QBC33DRAFT_560354 [Phialemonium atrogriseum]|uniref:Uncharacterized protein n=1 Tax=Phialemonium atrogriseum TaxID=1093897 RepID=A0AAJ0BXY3_9PEZI|nr:uncharacterized protein QBC33DRAFT_560354 [Phialemonium atrogriseum]KAK1765917.1 hypothetical protein QBC33DRAFT_560354 [Phialemonium atrogriseum]